MVDEFLKFIPKTVTFLDLTETCVLGYGLKDLADRDNLTIKITNTLIKDKSFKDLKLKILR